MELVVDTCFFIDLERQKLPKLTPTLENASLFISAITLSELMIGLHLAKNKDIIKKREAFLAKILADIQVLEFDEAIATLHAQYAADLIQQNMSIGAHDLIIAATAVYYQYPVLTRNTREFSRVKNLQVIEYHLAG